ncbi:MAG: N-acetyltransferase family protein [Roseiarcus sp.]
MPIRDAGTPDLPQILAIYNDVIATSTAVYSTEPVAFTERAEWFEARRRRGFPVLVADEGDGVLGFSSFGEFRGAWAGYRYSVEHSVHVRADARGKGVGRGLVAALFPLAAAQGKHVMIGGIDASNEGSLRFHERLGFERVGHFREVGRKFDRWLDLMFVQRFLDPPGGPR